MGTQMTLLPKIASDIAIWFPELEGRALAVADADQLTRENTPKLPLVMVALAREQSDQPLSSAKTFINLRDEFIIEFWLEPNRYKKSNGTESPFWSYFDYQSIRDRLLTGFTSGYLGPNGERISYRYLAQESSTFAVVLTFTFTASYQWCQDASLPDDDMVVITPQIWQTKICAPKGECLPEGFESGEYYGDLFAVRVG
jgi:hypothetical protein